MSGRRFLAVLTILAAGCAARTPRFEFTHPSMGTTFRLVFHAEDEEAAARAAAAAFARIEALDACLSDYDPDSELSRLSARSGAGPVPVSSELLFVLRTARSVSRKSGGAFDVTVGPLVRLWRRAARQGALPSDERLATARAAVGWERCRVDLDRGTVELTAPAMRLDLGGIAKGYALDEALVALAEHGIERALVEGGGDVAASGAPPGTAGWRVALSVDEEGGGGDAVLLAHGACATSGDAFRFVELDGVRYSHVVDPRTGLGVTSRQAATVLAPTGILADAWASALCVLPPEDGLAALRALPGVEARIWRLDEEKGGREPCDSAGFAGRMAR